MQFENGSPLVMDRAQESTAVRQVSDTGVKTVLFHVHDDDFVMDRLQAVLSIARACGAHIHCLHVTPIQAYTAVDTLGGTFVSQSIVDAFQSEAAKLKRKVEAQLAIEDVTWDYEEVTGELLPRLVHAAALADLVVTSREPRYREFGAAGLSLIGDLLGQLRSPLLVLGEGSPDDFDPLAPAVIGWNGSFEAATAVRQSLALLKLAGKVTAVEFTEERDRSFPSTRLLEYLSRHGIKAELEVHTASDDTAGALLRQCERHGAGLLVMGGYSHSRAGEFLFGGVTRELLEECPIALALAR